MRQCRGRRKVWVASFSTGMSDTPSSGYAASAFTPAASSMVADQSMVMHSWVLSPPLAITFGQCAIHGTRMPPSVRSILPPTSGQLSEKRSPPLSLVNTTRVLSAMPCLSSAAMIQPMPSSM
ncbi:hypothetical protein D3C87_550790 [compost metagenome]